MAGPDADGSGGGVEGRAAEVEVPASRSDVGQGLSLAVEIDGYSKFIPDPFAELVRELAAAGKSCRAEGHDGHDIGGTDTGMEASMRPDVDPFDGSGHRAHEAIDEVRAQCGE